MVRNQGAIDEVAKYDEDYEKAYNFIVLSTIADDDVYHRIKDVMDDLLAIWDKLAQKNQSQVKMQAEGAQLQFLNF